MPISRPTNIQKPFADTGAKNTIPVAATGTGKASYTAGFPPPTMLPLTAGGVPPEGKDFNGILYDITSHTLWVNAGGQYRFDSALSTAIGGYPAGMVLQSNDGLSAYVSAVNNNVTDFNTTPSSIGTLWLAYSGAAVANVTINTTGGNTTLTAIQSAATFITVTGTLVSNATLTLPAARGKWFVINNTTGAFGVTVLPSGGSGVPIFQGKCDSVYCDGTNIDYDLHSSQTRPLYDSTKHVATTEFVQAALATIAIPKVPYFNRTQLTASSGNFTVPAGITKIRAYAIGRGGDGAFGSGGTTGGAGGGGGGCAWGDIAVTPGQVIPYTINSSGTVFGTYLTATNGQTGSISARGAGGTATKSGAVLNGGTASGGEGGQANSSRINGRAGGASGSPLGTGGGAPTGFPTDEGAGGWGNDGGPTYGGSPGGPGNGGPSGAGGSWDSILLSAPGRTQFTEFTDPLLAPCNSGIVGSRTAGLFLITGGNGGTGGGGTTPPTYGGGAGSPAAPQDRRSDSVFGGGAAGSGNSSYTGGYGGPGGGGGGGHGSGTAGGTGGIGIICIFY